MIVPAPQRDKQGECSPHFIGGAAESPQCSCCAAISAQVWRHLGSHRPGFCFRMEFSWQSVNTAKSFCLDCGSTGNRFLCAPNFGHRPASDEAIRLLSDALL